MHAHCLKCKSTFEDENNYHKYCEMCWTYFTVHKTLTKCLTCKNNVKKCQSSNCYNDATYCINCAKKYSFSKSDETSGLFCCQCI